MRPAARRYVSNNGTKSTVSARSFGCEDPSVFILCVGHRLSDIGYRQLLGVSYWTRAVSPACWTVGCSKHGGVMALGLNGSEFNWREEQTEWNAEPISKKQKGKTPVIWSYSYAYVKVALSTNHIVYVTHCFENGYLSPFSFIYCLFTTCTCSSKF